MLYKSTCRSLPCRNSRETEVVTTTRRQAGRAGVRNPVGLEATHFAFSKTSIVALKSNQPPSSIFGGKAAGEWLWPLTSVENEWSHTSTSLHVSMAWRGTNEPLPFRGITTPLTRTHARTHKKTPAGATAPPPHNPLHAITFKPIYLNQLQL